MALQKSYEMENGTSGNYWKVVDIRMNTVENTCSVSVHLYKDSDARQADKSAMYSRKFDMDLSVLLDKSAETVDNPLVLAYDALKELDLFDGATDV